MTRPRGLPEAATPIGAMRVAATALAQLLRSLQANPTVEARTSDVSLTGDFVEYSSWWFASDLMATWRLEMFRPEDTLATHLARGVLLVEYIQCCRGEGYRFALGVEHSLAAADEALRRVALAVARASLVAEAGPCRLDPAASA